MASRYRVTFNRAGGGAQSANVIADNANEAIIFARDYIRASGGEVEIKEFCSLSILGAVQRGPRMRLFTADPEMIAALRCDSSWHQVSSMAPVRTADDRIVRVSFEWRGEGWPTNPLPEKKAELACCYWCLSNGTCKRRGRCSITEKPLCRDDTTNECHVTNRCKYGEGS